MDGAAAAEFSEFAHSRWPALVRLGYAVTGDPDLAEDLAQTALANAYASWSRVRKADDPDAYVRRIVLNAHQGSFRKRRVSERLTESPPDILAPVPDPAGKHGDRATVIAALGTLPRRQREVLVLKGAVEAQGKRGTSGLGGAMTIHDEHDFRTQLGTALDEFAPDPVPFHAVVRQGRAVMIRKRITAVAVGLAVLAAAALVPTLLHALHRTAPVTRHYHVTVNPPTPGSPQGLVASGLVNRARWQFFARYNKRQYGLCLGSRLGTGACGGGRPLGRAQAGTPPATLWGDGPEAARLPNGRWVRTHMVYGYVRHDVDHLRVDLSNGQVLTLRPVDLFGARYARWVAFAVPFAAAVKEISVYSATAELEHTFPFTRGGEINIVRWLAPGQPAAPAPVTGQVGSGTTAGHHWVVSGYIGPWGSCFKNATVHMNICSTRSGPLRPGVVAKRLVTSHFFNIHLGLSVLQVDPAVSYLLVTRSQGGALRLPTAILGGQKYCVLPDADHNHVVSWTAYDAAGHLLGNGSVSRLLS